MNIKARLSKLEDSGPTPMRIVKLYDGEAAPRGIDGLTVIIHKPGTRP